MATDPRTIPTQLVATRGPVAVPEAYTVPGVQEIQLSSVTADYDGSGASGDFDATLSLYSQDNQLLSRTKAGPTVVVGDSGVATWVPFLRKQTAASTSTGLPYFQAFRSSDFSLAYDGLIGSNRVEWTTLNTFNGADAVLNGSGDVFLDSVALAGGQWEIVVSVVFFIASGLTGQIVVFPAYNDLLGQGAQSQYIDSSITHGWYVTTTFAAVTNAGVGVSYPINPYQLVSVTLGDVKVLAQGTFIAGTKVVLAG